MSNNQKGFTLIEVLIALAILSIALMTIIKYTSQNIRDTIYVQNKMTATWVAKQIMNEALVGVLKLPEAPDHLEQTTEMLGNKWPWEANITPTPNAHIKEIHVDVFQNPNHGKLISLTSYIYVK